MIKILNTYSQTLYYQNFCSKKSSFKQISPLYQSLPTQTVKPEINSHSNLKKVLLGGASLAAVVLSSVILYKQFKIPIGFNKLKHNEIRLLKSKVQNISNKDANYKKDLITGLKKELGIKGHLSELRLASVVGEDELKMLLQTFSPTNFSTGKDLENIRNCNFQVNLHMHTHYSDGKMKVSELLDQAAKYADKVFAKTGKPFIIAITDHENVNGAKEAIKLIAQDPIKYKNLKFVAGMEKGFITPSPYSPWHNPTEMAEVITYAINPFSPEINDFVSILKTNRQNLAKLMMNEAAERFALPKLKEIKGDLIGDFNLDMVRMDVHWAVAEHLRNIFPAKQNEINEFCRKFRPYCEGDDIKYPTKFKTETTISEIFDVIRRSWNGFVGFAHPAFIMTKGFKNPESMIKEFKQKGANIFAASEMYYEQYGNLDKKFINIINKICETERLLPTSGIDNHSNNIFMPRPSQDLIKEKLSELLK